MPKPNEQQPAENQQQESSVSADDLGLIDPSLEDATKDHAELWAEIEESEGAASGDSKVTPPDDKKGGEDGKKADAAAKDDQVQESDDKEPDDKTSGEQKPQEVDLWADAKPEQKAAFEAAQAQLKKLEQAERSNRGRLSAMQRQINDLTRQPAAKPAAKSKEGQTEDDGLLASAEWKEFQEDYPAVAGPMAKMIGSLQEKIARQERELSAIGNEHRQSALAKQEELLEKQHPDWTDVTADQSFAEWLNGQPRHIREAAIRNANEIVDAEEAADVVGRFKAHREQQAGGNAQPQQQQTQRQNGNGNTNNRTMTGKRQLQLASAAAARSSGPGVANGISEDGDPETLWKQMDEMDRRQARA